MVRLVLPRTGLVALTLGDGRVQPEELGDCYADGGEGERGAEPG